MLKPVGAESTVEEFIRSFNERDLDAFVATLDPEVELHSLRGLVRGIPAARVWATRVAGGVQQTVIIAGTETAGDKVLARIRRDWHWDEDGTHAASDDLAWLFGLTRNRIRSWRPFEDLSEARAAFNAL